MRISAVNSNYSTINQRKLRENTTPTQIPVGTTPQAPAGMTMISFKSGNVGDILHVVGECKPFAQVGGVATVALHLENRTALQLGVVPLANGRIV